MNDMRPGRLRQAMLLLVALLHLAGAAALPVLHEIAEASAAASSVAAIQRDGGKAPAIPPHDESNCLVCQASHALGDLPGGAELAFAAEREAPAPAAVPVPRHAPRDAATLARAPPVHA